MICKYDVPQAVYLQVVAFVADYDRRQRVLDESDSVKHSLSVLIWYRIIQTAIDEALSETCRGETPRVIPLLRVDIGNRNGFEYSCAKRYYSTKGLFWARKRRAVLLIAEKLNLI